MLGQESPWIIETAAEKFEQDVIERSMTMPVLVDFWATWCGPCQQLGPVLEKLAREGNGKFLLVKVDVDQQPEIAGWFGVQSIPVVFVIMGGQAVDQFMGAVSEEEIRERLKRFLPSPAQSLLIEAKTLMATAPNQAEAKFREVLELEPGLDAAKIGLAQVVLAQHRDAEAAGILEELERRGYLEPEAEQIKAEVELRRAAAEAGDVGAARKNLSQNPGDPDLKIKLADALAAVQQYPEALELCLNVVQEHKATHAEVAKTTMVQIFQILGSGNDLTQQYRRKLSTALY